jgi:hypothetical protein
MTYYLTITVTPEMAKPLPGIFRHDGGHGLKPYDFQRDFLGAATRGQIQRDCRDRVPHFFVFIPENSPSICSPSVFPGLTQSLPSESLALHLKDFSPLQSIASAPRRSKNVTAYKNN